ncbi:MAG: hemolysin family protein [Cytophagaceae bacterium]|jgi:CBS domain containing-hemolysin-like protein|nr:hemolysin family protein [Cytophagaceae bacterium]
MILDIIVTLALVFLNGFFVAAEFALVKIRSSQLEIMAANGDSRAILSLKILKNLDAYLSACQLGITLASLALGWIGEPMIEALMHKLFELMGLNVHDKVVEYTAVALAFSTLTFLHIVFGEQAPKMLAIQRSETTTLFVSYPVKIFYFICKPAIWILNYFSNLILKALGLYSSHGHEQHSAEELELLIDQGKETGVIEEGEHEIIKNAFGFDQLIARQVMLPRPKIHALDLEKSVDEIINIVIDEGYSRLPVYREDIDNIEGILYTKDLLRMIHKKEKVDLKGAIRPVFFVPETKKVHDLLRELQRRRLHMAIVTNEYGSVSGIVTIEDIMEELIGEIQDEHDDEAPIVEALSDREFLVNALSSITDVNEYLPHPLPEADEYETVAGYINMLFGKIPDTTDAATTDDYVITVTKASKQTALVIKLVTENPYKKNN